MKTKLFTYEIVNQNNTQLRTQLTVWWSGDHINIVDTDGVTESMSPDELLDRLQAICFPERCLQIISQMLKGLENCEAERKESNG